jgi:alpha-N-arabinofuranosidase
MFKSLRAPFFATVLATTCAAQTPDATLTVQLDKSLHDVSPKLYGVMTEEINYSYDGGIYAEMVRNRTFQDRDRRARPLGSGGEGMPRDDDEWIRRGLARSLRLDSSRGPNKSGGRQK